MPGARLRTLREHTADRDVAWTAMAGDYNCVDQVEGRWCVSRRVVVPSPEPEAAVFEDLFFQFVEVAQPAVTRRRLIERSRAGGVFAPARTGRSQSSPKGPPAAHPC